MTEITHVAKDVSIEKIVSILERDAAVIIDGVLPQSEVESIGPELGSSFAPVGTGEDKFFGFRTKRIGGLLAKSKGCRKVAEHELPLKTAKAVLGPFCDDFQLHFTQAVAIGPGEAGQMLHRDRGVWGGYLSRKIETQLSTIWAITDFTHENGATRLVPGSHKWDRDRAPEPDQVVSAEMKAGSVLLYTGSVLHGGGENSTSDDTRVGLLIHYTLNWLRQEENQYLCYPPEVAAQFSPKLRALIGYSKGGPNLGFFSSPGGEPHLEIVPPERIFGENVDNEEVDQAEGYFVKS